jgi:uncharacterized protein (TIGR02271 family)
MHPQHQPKIGAMTEHIVAVFSTEAAATAAKESLLNLGIPVTAIRQYVSDETSRDQITPPPAEHVTTRASGGGFWAWLFGEDTTSETTTYRHDAYDRTATAGNFVVGVRVDEDSQIHPVITALEEHDPLDIDEGADEVVGNTGGTAPRTGTSTVGRHFAGGETAQAGEMDTAVSSGRAGTPATPLTGAATADTSSFPAGVPGERDSGMPSGRAGTSPAPVTGASASPVPGTPGTETSSLPAGVSPVPNTSSLASGDRTVGTRAGEEVVPLSEEQLEIGKRTVDRGTTRVRRYVVEKPVEETVNLQTERVTVERRQPLDNAGTPGTGAFEERVVEVRETAEEPVVSKTARVAEEVVIGRETTEQTETVRDTVRREDVEISKDGTAKP